jgi:hypothetical protein
MQDEVSFSRAEALTLFNATVISSCLFLLGFGFFKALVLFPVVALCTYLNYGARWVLRAGFGLLVLTTLVMLDVVPPLGQWRDAGMRMLAAVSEIAQSHAPVRGAGE